MLRSMPGVTATVLPTLALGTGQEIRGLQRVQRRALETARAALLTPVMASLFYDVRPTDLQTFAIVAIGLTVTALSASLVPAAARIDPAQTLR